MRLAFSNKGVHMGSVSDGDACKANLQNLEKFALKVLLECN